MRFGIWLFLHLLGMAMWVGGMLTMGFWTARARRTGDPRVVAFVYATARRLYRGVVSSGAVLTVVGGVALMIETGRPWFRPFPEHWLFQMQVLGFVMLLVTLFYIVPASGSLADMAARAAEEGDQPAEFAVRVKRQAIAASVVGFFLIYTVLLGGLRF